MICEKCKEPDGAYWITDGKLLCSVCSSDDVYRNDEVITREGYHYMHMDWPIKDNIVDIRGIIYIMEETE